MDSVLEHEVMEFNGEFEKFASDIQFLVEEVKEEVQKTLEEYRELQSDQSDRIEKIEGSIQHEVENIQNIYESLREDLELLKQRTENIIGQIPDSPSIDPEKLEQLRQEQNTRFEEFQQQLSRFDNNEPEKLREELIAGIRMLGERVSKAIEKINERMDSFVNEFQQQSELTESQNEATTSEEKDDTFGSIKESNLLGVDDYEIVPKESLKKLSDLFNRQSGAIKQFIEKQESRLIEFEYLIRSYDEENTKILEILDIKVKRNFRITIGAIAITLIVSIVLHFI